MNVVAAWLDNDTFFLLTLVVGLLLGYAIGWRIAQWKGWYR